MADDLKLARTPRVNAGDVVRAAGDDIPPWLRKLVWLMDDAVRIPGTRQGVGLDALLGAILPPGAGDLLTGFTTFALIAVAWRKGVPGVVIFRMVMQQLLDLGVGSIPIVGDIFDVFSRANRSNLELIEKHRHTREAMTYKEWLWLGLALLFAVGLVLLPIVLLYVVVTRFVAWLSH